MFWSNSSDRGILIINVQMLETQVRDNGECSCECSLAALAEEMFTVTGKAR